MKVGKVGSGSQFQANSCAKKNRLYSTTQAALTFGWGDANVGFGLADF